MREHIFSLKSVNAHGTWMRISVIARFRCFSSKLSSFLHPLADSNSAIFNNKASVLIGCGAYQVGRIEQLSWSLVRYSRYFGLGGHTEQVEFWCSAPT